MSEWIAERPGRHGQPPSAALAQMLCRVGMPLEARWTLWLRALGAYIMPPLAQQAAQLRSLLSSTLPNQAELEADAQAAMLGAIGGRIIDLPDGAVALLSKELAFVRHCQ